MKDKKDKIYYFQEKSNDILDLQDELTIEEIGIYLILKAGYFKYAGELKKENALAAKEIETPKGTSI